MPEAAAATERRSRDARPEVGARRRATEVVFLVAIVAIPLVTRDAFVADRVGKYMLYGVLALSIDLVWGFGGMFTFGHAAFFGWGGYVVAMLTVKQGWFLPVPFWLALPAAVAGTALLAYLVGVFVFSGRLALRGVYFAVVTLALSYLSEKLADAGGQITGGQNGILQRVKLGVPWFAFNKGYGFYALAALILVAVYAFLRWYVASPAGLVLRGIRENEERVSLLGYDVARVKCRVFVLSGAIAGFAGAIFHVHDTIVSPSAVGVQASTLALLWVALGGRGTLLGPIAGAVGLSYLTATLSSGDVPRLFLDFWLLLVGAILVGVIMVFPAGLFGYLSRRRPVRANTEAAAP